MFLLDTAAFIELTSGQEGPVRAKVTWAESNNRVVRASVVSIGKLRSAIYDLAAQNERDNWTKRLNLAVKGLEDKSLLAEVDRRVAEQFAMLAVAKMLDEDGQDIGEAERLVVATAVAEGLTLLTTTPAHYEAARAQNLLVEKV